MGLRRLLTVLLGLALFWAPLAHQTGVAMAAAPPDHSMQMTMKGHCDQQPNDLRDKLPGKPCCAAMVLAIEVPASFMLQPHPVLRAPERAEVWRFVTGFVDDLPTPPPRS